MNQNFGGIIWTNHALQRLKERGISQGHAFLAFTKPDTSRFARNKGAWIYNKVVNGWNIEVVAKKNERKEWIILSVWARLIAWKKEYQTIKKRNWFSKLLRQIFFGDYR